VSLQPANSACRCIAVDDSAPSDAPLDPWLPSQTHFHVPQQLCITVKQRPTSKAQQQQLEGCMTKQKTKLEQHATRGGDNAF
jgi:hypothetical protein